MNNYMLLVVLYEGGLLSLRINQAHSFRLSTSECQGYFKDHVMWWLKREEIEHHQRDRKCGKVKNKTGVMYSKMHWDRGS